MPSRVELSNPESLSGPNPTLENSLVRAEFDRRSGAITIWPAAVAEVAARVEVLDGCDVGTWTAAESENSVHLRRLSLGREQAIDSLIEFSLAESEAALGVMIRLHNRTLVPQPVSLAIRISEDSGTALELGPNQAAAVVGPGGAVTLAWKDLPEDVSVEGGSALVTAAGRLWLMPRHSAEWRFAVWPHAARPGSVWLGHGGAVSVDPEGIAVYSPVPMTEARLVLADTDGQEFSAPISCSAGDWVAFRAAELPPGVVSGVLVGGDHTVECRFQMEGEQESFPVDVAPSWAGGKPWENLSDPLCVEARYLQKAMDPTGDAYGWRHARLDPGLAAGVFVLDAIALASKQDWSAAIAAAEAAMLSAADDPLIWWFCAACRRNLGEDTSEALMNAHFLSPGDPVLRAEAFLSTPVGEGGEVSPLLGPLVAAPGHAVDALSIYLEHGLFADAARLAEEALRAAEIPEVRVLHGWNLLTNSRMVAEGYACIQRVLDAGVGLPELGRYPVGLRARGDISERFSF